MHQRHVDHRRLVDDEYVAVERVLGVALKPHNLGGVGRGIVLHLGIGDALTSDMQKLDAR